MKEQKEKTVHALAFCCATYWILVNLAHMTTNRHSHSHTNTQHLMLYELNTLVVKTFMLLA